MYNLLVDFNILFKYCLSLNFVHITVVWRITMEMRSTIVKLCTIATKKPGTNPQIDGKLGAWGKHSIPFHSYI